MSNFTTEPFTTNPYITNPWVTNPWVDGVPFEFTNTEATLEPYIEVTGTPTILWTWSDGSTSAVAIPGEKTLTGTHTLLVTPWSAVTKLGFGVQALTGEVVTQAWENVEYLYFHYNYLLSGTFVFRPWVDTIKLYIMFNSFASLSGSLQTQIKMTHCYLENNQISSQTEIDKLYADLLINAADPGRSVVCSVNTSGPNMAAPSAAGLADIDDLRNLHGWTVTHA